MFALFGYSPGEFRQTQNAWTGMLHPDDRERVLESVRAASESRDADWQERYRLRRKDGTYAEVLDRGFFLRDPQGRALRAVGGMLDISKQQRAEGDLRLLRRAVEASDSAIVISDARLPNMPLVYVNSAF